MASLAYSNNAWGKRSIRVCFASQKQLKLTSLPDDLPPHEKEIVEMGKGIDKVSNPIRTLIKSIITKEFTLKNTGIEFTGFETCSEFAQESDAVLFLGSDNLFSWRYGNASINRALTSDSHYSIPSPNQKPYVYLMSLHSLKEEFKHSTMTAEQFFMMTAVHEFGHLAGLAHENFRLSQKNPDLNCKLTQDGYDYLIRNEDEEFTPNTKIYSVYDPNSVMSDCFSVALSKNTGLKFILDTALSTDYPQETIAGAFPINAISLTYSSLFKSEVLNRTRTLYQVRVGLSKGDIHTLRCIHGFYSDQLKKERCQKDFDPRIN